MNVLTGGTGRLGKHLVRSLLSSGEKVKMLIRDKNDEIPKGAIAHCGDITKPGTLEGLVERGGKDTVFHLAAAIDESLSEEAFYRINVLGTENLLSACRGKAVERFVFVSSISVYGNPDSLPADEATTKNPITKYGRSKMLAEEVVVRMKKEIPFTIIRPGMIYGPGFDEGYIPVLKALEKGKMPIIGDGNNRIPLIHISDAVSALLRASESIDAERRDFNIAGPGYPTQRELFSLASKELGAPEPKREISLWMANTFLPIAAAMYGMNFSRENLAQLTRDRAFDCSKIKKAIGFVPKVPIAQGIKEMVTYYREMKG
ncbi:MAG: NAD(P)-dependent oxidoreductase [Candidatus Micrarchaeota archaeon]